MLELYQFELSQFSEKVRLILDYKGLAYRKIEVTPGMGQLDLFRISGQRQAPVLKDGNTIVADSTTIALYLDKTYPDKPIIPTQPQQKATCLLLEQWADDSIGARGRILLLEGLKNSNLRTSILPIGTPDLLKNLIGSIPREAMDAPQSRIDLSSARTKFLRLSYRRYTQPRRSDDRRIESSPENPIWSLSQYPRQP
jgi:glutathione S-transferase